jgi:hypothetical protein
MHNTKSNREVVRAGHEFARAVTSDTAVIDIAKMISELATSLDVANVRANVMAGEVLRLNSLLPQAIEALAASGEHVSLIANLKEALITPNTDQWIKTLHVEAVGQTRKYVQTMTNHQLPGVSHCVNIIAQLEMDLLRANQQPVGSAA